jgi:predicted transcriptional regulator of viral defense system
MPLPTDLLAQLPDAFRRSEALTRISERQLRRLVAEGHVLVVARDVYRKADWAGDDDLLEIASKARRGALCLRTALARHELIDDIPAEIDVALPRGSWLPHTTTPVRWHHFDPRTFTVGIEQTTIGDGVSISIYTADRSIVDAFRLRHLYGPDLAHTALKRRLRQGGQPAALLHLAQSFPRTLPVLQQTLEILL